MAIHCRWWLRAGQAGVRFPAAKSVGASDNEAMAMTEQVWLASHDPEGMLRYLWYGKEPAWKALLTRARLRPSDITERKLRLFACACVRKCGGSLNDNWQVRDLLQAAERFADGRTARSKFLRVAQRIVRQGNLLDGHVGLFLGLLARNELTASAVARRTNSATQYMAHHGVVDLQALNRALSAALRGDAWLRSQCMIQADLVRDIFGNPFRPVTLDPAWRTSNVTALAQAIYDDRAFDRLPILADALEDAGCDNADILNHCRQPGEHVRGCWVVDLVLKKE
jgi:hypothetical protein